MYHNNKPIKIISQMETTKITKQELLTILANVKGCTIVTVTRVTTPKMTKTGNPYFSNLVEKLTTAQYNFNMSYTNSVNNRIEKCTEEKGDFQAEAPKGKTWVIPNKILMGKDEHLIRFFEMKNTKPASTFFIDKQVATPEQVAIIKNFLPSKTYSAKQVEAGIELDEQVIPMDLKLSNIKQISINKTTYEIQ